MNDNNESSGVNTILIVIVLLVIVGLAFWFFGGRLGAPAAPEQQDLNVDVNLPTGGEGDQQGGTQPQQ